jgi:hypothetical protein
LRKPKPKIKRRRAKVFRSRSKFYAKLMFDMQALQGAMNCLEERFKRVEDRDNCREERVIAKINELAHAQVGPAIRKALEIVREEAKMYDWTSNTRRYSVGDPDGTKDGSKL